MDKFENCDGALWSVDEYEEEQEKVKEINSTAFKYEESNVEPDHLGFKYHILTFKKDSDTIEIVSAYIGDVKYFIDNQAKAGYNGMMVKSKATPKKTVKKIFERVLSNFKFPESQIKSALKQV
jgi:hypothetical protein